MIRNIPQRIQFKQDEGLPENTKYVGRPTKWGNPFNLKDNKREVVLARYAVWLQTQLNEDPKFLDDLIGYNLACYCKLTQPCHASILLHKIYQDHIWKFNGNAYGKNFWKCIVAYCPVIITGPKGWNPNSPPNQPNQSSLMQFIQEDSS